MRFLPKAKPWNGRKMEFPVKVSKNSTGGSFASFDTFSTSTTDNRQKLSFDPKSYQITSALPLDELAANDSDEQVLNLMALTMESDAQDAADDIGTMLYSDGTGNSSKDFDGLANGVDDGTTAASYGGLTRATYSPVLSSTVTASGGTLTLAKMRTLFNAVSDGIVAPTAILTTKAVAGLYEQLLSPQERIMKDVSPSKGDRHGGSGFKTMDFLGLPVLADNKCTSGVMFMLNEDYIDWYAKEFPMASAVKIKSSSIEGNVYEDVPAGMGFSWGGWIKPANAAAVVGHTYLFGNFIVRDPKRSGKLTGITSV